MPGSLLSSWADTAEGRRAERRRATTSPRSPRCGTARHRRLKEGTPGEQPAAVAGPGGGLQRVNEAGRARVAVIWTLGEAAPEDILEVRGQLAPQLVRGRHRPRDM